MNFNNTIASDEFRTIVTLSEELHSRFGSVYLSSVDAYQINQTREMWPPKCINYVSWDMNDNGRIKAPGCSSQISLTLITALVIFNAITLLDCTTVLHELHSFNQSVIYFTSTDFVLHSAGKFTVRNQIRCCSECMQVY